MTYSALNPSGSYQADAMDEVERWNANRGDQWSQYALNLMGQKQRDQAAQAGEDWRKDVALRELGLRDKEFTLGREDSAAERAQKYGFETRKLGMDEARNNAYLADITARQTAEKEAKLRRDTFRKNLMEGKVGGLDDRAKAALQGMASADVPYDAMVDIFARQFGRPLETQMRREDTRTVAAEQAAADLEGGIYKGVRELNRLKQTATRGGIKDINVAEGGMRDIAEIENAPEFTNEVQSLREQLKQVPDEYGIGGGIGLGVGQGEEVARYVGARIQDAARKIAIEYGGNPQVIAKALYRNVVSGDPGVSKSWLAKTLHGLAEIPSLSMAETKAEAALRTLQKQYGE
jgi:hypothetical protein